MFIRLDREWPMNEHEMATSVDVLASARRSGVWIEALPVAPSSVAEAHAIQDQVAALLEETIGGCKANAPPNEGPTRGFIYARTICPSPARVSPSAAPHLGVEAEIAFRFARDLPPRKAPYAREEVAEEVVA